MTSTDKPNNLKTNEPHDLGQIFNNPSLTFNQARGFGVWDQPGAIEGLEWELGILWMWSEVALEAPEDMPAGSMRNTGNWATQTIFWRGE